MTANTDLTIQKLASDHLESQADLRNALLAHKTELIGELARTMANQFNNIMMAVSSYAELELKKAPPAQRRSLEQVLSNTGRATSLIQKLLAFSRKRVAVPQPLQLNDALKESQELLEQVAGANIEVLLSLDPNVQRINADPIEVEQMLLSLTVNARNAMPTGGTLTVRTKLVDVEEGFLTDGEDGPGKYAMLSVEDTGADDAVTDGEAGSATGQNLRFNVALAAVRGIVKESGGLARFSTQPGRGGSFAVYFPALGKGVPKAQDEVSANHATVTKTILVVEDDDAVRVPTAEFLMMEGFKVLQARTGPEALRVVLRNRSPLDLLITDIVMPKMTGREVAEKLLEMHPHLKVLYMSGDADQTALSPAAQATPHALLQKPFRLDKLKGKILDLFEQ